ncbi:MAG: hypothetical protein AOA65_1222 [Candidatus Bathyarchaeota archaeon BA1]|nr:MAG: hypothetical protein AOA65_1222 [Candidatus Bathyarchaeota archaeon BA1]
MEIRVGTSGWSYGPIDKFKSLSYIGHVLNAVEVNTTFYGGLDRWRYVARSWAKKVQEDFHFVLKAYSGITHGPGWSRRSRVTNPLSPQAVEFYNEMLEGCKIIGPQAKALLFQFPASLQCTKKNVEKLVNFFSAIQRPKEHKLVIEFRSREWFQEENIKWILNLMESLDLVYAVVSSPITHLQPLVFSKDGLAYLRIHGFTGWYTTDYLHTESPLHKGLPAIFDILVSIYQLERNKVNRTYLFWDNTDIITEGVYAYPHIQHALAFNFIWTGQREYLRRFEELFTRVLLYYTGRLTTNERIMGVVQQETSYVESMRRSWEELRSRLNET